MYIYFKEEHLKLLLSEKSTTIYIFDESLMMMNCLLQLSYRPLLLPISIELSPLLITYFN